MKQYYQLELGSIPSLFYDINKVRRITAYPSIWAVHQYACMYYNSICLEWLGIT